MKIKRGDRDKIFAICTARCRKCGLDDVSLFIPSSDYYDLLCIDCMQDYDLDTEATRRNLGKSIEKDIRELLTRKP